MNLLIDVCVIKMHSPTLRCTDNVLFVTARAGFGQTGDGGCMTKQHGPGTNLSRNQKKGKEEQYYNKMTQSRGKKG